MDLLTLMDRYGDDSECRALLEQLRWPTGVRCPRCGSERVGTVKGRFTYHCNAGCSYEFSVTSGTIMHDSHLPLRKWFVAIYLMCESKKSVSALQLKRTLGVAYRTAWYLSHRIREAMANDPFEGPTLLGVVEVDEMLVGGKAKNKNKSYRGNKTWVAGAIQRDGQVRLEQIPNVRRRTLHEFIERTVHDKAEAIYTDELKSYLGIADHDTRHEMVSHSIEQWVVGDLHTNSIEGVWGLFKRSLMGSFHKVSTKHLDRYLSELEWRFNNRENDHIFIDTLRRMVQTETLPYEKLVA